MTMVSHGSRSHHVPEVTVALVPHLEQQDFVTGHSKLIRQRGSALRSKPDWRTAIMRLAENASRGLYASPHLPTSAPGHVESSASRVNTDGYLDMCREHDDIPDTDELGDLCDADQAFLSDPLTIDSFAYSDDLSALKDSSNDRQNQSTVSSRVIRHRTWNTVDIFRSEPCEPPTSPVLEMAAVASSPPLTPSSQGKRKLEDIDLGTNHIARNVKAKRSYYGVDIHALLEQAQLEEGSIQSSPQLPSPPAEHGQQGAADNLLWTEKYRARKFTDLIGDERTHRAVMHWLKRWDSIVFPVASREKQRPKDARDASGEQRPHRKILLLAGPPGLGKTTLAHVCARQAGYEVQEINASDERSSVVVKGRIRDMVGTENVRGVNKAGIKGTIRKAGKPVCVIVDEVDGVTAGASAGGAGGGEGGFVKALIDLVMLDQKNTGLSNLQQAPTKKIKGERFRLLRPLILVCNDVYHPSLKLLRQSSLAEIIHMRKPAIETIASRMDAIFRREGISCEMDGVRRLCEATWGVSNRKEDRANSSAGDGDMRGIMVVSEWVAGKLRSENLKTGQARLTRRWVEENLLQNLSHGGGSARGLGRGGPKDIVERVFQEGAGFPKTCVPSTPPEQLGNSIKGVAEGSKRTATERLRELVDAFGDTDRIMTDVFATYPERTFQDDTLLSKPDSAYEWLYFHDRLSSAVFGSNDWELAPYLNAPVLAFHHLFASPTRAQYNMTQRKDDTRTDMEKKSTFEGIQGSWAAHEATKQNMSTIQTLQSGLSIGLGRQFTSTAALATELVPQLLRMLTPVVNPIVVGGSGNDKSTATVRKSSELQLVERAVRAMIASGVRFERIKVNAFEDGDAFVPGWNSSQWIYRMSPSLDLLGSYETGGKEMADGQAAIKQRFAVRQVLDQEHQREERRRAEAARAARSSGSVTVSSEPSNASTAAPITEPKVHRDFFGRIIDTPSGPPHGSTSASSSARHSSQSPGKVWVTYHEGYSCAVRKPVTLSDVMRGL